MARIGPLLRALGALVLSMGPVLAEPSAVPHLTLERDGDTVHVSGEVTAGAAITVSARLEIEKSDTSGTVRSAQEAPLELTAGQTGQVASVSVSLSGAGHVAATLTVRDGEDTIASVSSTLTE